MRNEGSVGWRKVESDGKESESMTESAKKSN